MNCLRYVRACVSLCIFSYSSLSCTVLLSSLKHPISPTFCNMITGSVTCGAAKAGAGNNALMRSYTGGSPLLPFAPEKVTLSGNADSSNPLFDQAILYISGIVAPGAFGRPDMERIITVTEKEPATVIMVDTSFSLDGKIMRTTGPLRDATGKQSSGIVALEGTQGDMSGAFAAVKPAEGSFGTPGSGIAVISFGSVSIEKDKKKTTEWHFNQINLAHTDKEIAACPIDITTNAAAIGNNLSQVADHVALHWNGTLGRLFIGLDVTAGSGSADGACGLLVGTLAFHECKTDTEAKAHTHKYLHLAPCVPHDAIVAGSSAVVAARGAGSRVAIHEITTFKTSTDLWYIAVVGGCGDPETTKNIVSVFPLHGETGTIAHKAQEPVALFGSKEYPAFRARHMRTRACSCDDIAVQYDPATAVGGGPLPVGPIEKIIAVRDAVFAVVGGASADHGGVYHSQAILDDKGCITGWTYWRPVYRSTYGTLQTAFYDTVGGYFTLFNGPDKDQECSFLRTEWGSGDASKSGPLVAFLRTQYAKHNSGIRGYADIPAGTKGFPYLSCMIVSGYQAITYALMASLDESKHMKCTYGDEFKKEGVIVHHQGPAVAKLGTIEAIAPAATDTQAWLFFGGTGGLAVYASQDGSGWDPYELLNMQDLHTNRTYLPLGSYSFVRRLLHDGDYLYVLTDETFDRIDLTLSSFNPKETYLAKTTLATRASFGSLQSIGAFTDVIVSGKIAFLATSQGLYRVGNDADIRSAACPAEVAWTPISLGNHENSIVHLSAITATGNLTDLARCGGGNLLVVQGYAGRNYGSIKRFIIKDIEHQAIDNTVVAAIPDVRIEHAPCMFRRIGYFSPQYVTDGALWLYIRKQPSQQFSSVCTMRDMYPIHDAQIKLHNTPESNLLFAKRLQAGQGSWWVLGQTAVVNE